MTLTEISRNNNRKVSGYMLNIGFSKDNQKKIVGIIKDIKDTFGNVILDQPAEALHVTLMDWIAPLVEYDRDRDVLFKEGFPQYDKTFSELTDKSAPFTVIFDTIKVSPAAIYIQGYDAGQFKSLRDAFMAETTLVSGTKQPPKIIHCTIARFGAEVEMGEIERHVETISIHLEQNVDGYRLVHETETPMLAFEVLKRYQLLR